MEEGGSGVERGWKMKLGGRGSEGGDGTRERMRNRIREGMTKIKEGRSMEGIREGRRTIPTMNAITAASVKSFVSYNTMNIKGTIPQDFDPYFLSNLTHLILDL